MRHPRFHPAPLALAVTLALSALGNSAANAQPAELHSSSKFNISLAAQPLGSALNELARQAKLQLMVHPDLVAGKSAPAISGNLTGRQALDRLLGGSGLTAIIEGNSVVIKPTPADASAVTLPAVNVTASTAMSGDLPKPYAGGQVARGARLGMLGNQDFLDTPFNVTAYTSELIENQQSRNIVDVIANDASTQPGGPWHFDNFYIRGFAINREEIGFDGLYGIASAEGNVLDGIERVEVLKGPSTLVNGSAPKGTAGGAINLVPKRAGDTPLTRLTTSYMSDSNIGGSIDIGRRFGPDNAFGARVNAALSNGESGADRENQKVSSFAAGLDYRSESLRLSADFGNSNQKVQAAKNTVRITAPQLPSAPSGDTNVWPSWSYQDKEHTFGVLRADYDVTKDLSFGLAYGKAKSKRDAVNVPGVLINTAGDMTFSANRASTETDRESVEATTRFRFETGPIKHQAVLAVTNFTSDITNYQPTMAYAATSNIYNPVALPEPANLSLDGPQTNLSGTKMRSYAVTDTLSIFDDRLLLTLGVRHQKIDVKAYNFATGILQPPTYAKSETTPALGVVFKATNAFSLYANYVEALSQGATAPTAAINRNEVFAPFVSKQAEIGAKVDWGTTTTTLSAFEITRPSGVLDAANFYSIDGEQRNRGLEFQVFGELTRGVRLLGGVTWTEAILTKTQLGLFDGKKAAGVPEWAVKMGGEWDVTQVPGLTLTARALYASSQAFNAANTISLPSWTRLDLGARYATKFGDRPVVLRASVENATDRSYWDAASAYQSASYAAPRTVLLSASIDF